MWAALKLKLTNMWEKIKKFYSDSEIIFLSRTESMTGFLFVVMGALDFSPLASVGLATGLNWKQTVSFGSVMIIKGIVQEWARRRRATDLTS